MAYQLSRYGNYGNGSAGPVTDPSGQINAYANVTAISGSTITIGTPTTSSYSSFAVGQEILLHVSAQISGTDGAYLSHYQTAHITAVSGSVLTLDNPVTDGVLIALSSLANYVVQAVAIPSFTTLTLTSATLAPTPYNQTNKYGGIIAIKSTSSLVLNGGKIDLTGRGIPIASKTQRIVDPQEKQGTANTDPYSGWENHITARRLYLNSGDGTAFILVANLNVQNTASRIGYISGTGQKYTRSAANTAVGAAGIGSGCGGSVILLAAGTISGFDPKIISTQPSATDGQGLGRCYIASNTKLAQDEGLYAKDIISDPNRIRTLGITDFGGGNFGAVSNPTAPLNNYGAVSTIDSSGKVITLSNFTTSGIAQFAVGNYVLFQAAVAKGSDTNYLGTIFRTKILAWDGVSTLTLKDSINSVFPAANLFNYDCQIITVPDFANLTISSDYTATPAYNSTSGYGGVCAFMCNGTLDITGGKLDMISKGNAAKAPASAALSLSNSGMCDSLPISQGNGSVFFVANTVKLDANSRIGATYDGSLLGGSGGGGNTGGGYIGIDGNIGSIGGGGSGNMNGSTTNGGSYILAVVNTLNFIQSAFSTGGNGVRANVSGSPGGSGYGGGGGSGGGWVTSGAGYNGGSSGNMGAGGGSGNCFIYANNVTSSNNYAGTVLGGTT